MAKAEYAKLYKTKRWQDLRKRKLRTHPWCQCPHHLDQKVPAQVVDHITPHKGNLRLFWDWKNLQSMTKSCHDAAKQTYERSGYWPGCDASGNPIDKDHHWNE